MLWNDGDILHWDDPNYPDLLHKMARKKFLGLHPNVCNNKTVKAGIEPGEFDMRHESVY